jgi:membrane fusion protein (multidrug efflux system)
MSPRLLFLLLTLNWGVNALAAKAPEMPPPVVQVVAAQAQDWQPQITATGSLAALQGITVKSEIPGRITAIYVKSGQDVKQGQKLFALNQDILQAQLQSNQANLVLRQEQFKRSQLLIKTHAIAAADFDTARANLLTAQAQMQQAQAQLDQAVIKAPFAGRLGLRSVSLGDYVSPGQALINLQSLDPIIVNFSVPEVYLSQIHRGDRVQLQTDAFPNQVFSGIVYATESQINADTRTLSMRASIPNPDKKLLPGGFVTLTLGAGKSTPVIVIPQTALASSLQGNYVYKVVNNKAVKTPVTVLYRSEQQAYITQGLQVGDSVISDGQLKINGNNTPVIVAPATHKP